MDIQGFGPEGYEKKISKKPEFDNNRTEDDIDDDKNIEAIEDRATYVIGGSTLAGAMAASSYEYQAQNIAAESIPLKPADPEDLPFFTLKDSSHAPDITIFNGAVHISNATAASAAIGLGLGAAAAGSGFGLLQSMREAWHNKKFFDNFDDHLLEVLDNYHGKRSLHAFQKFCSKKFKSQITFNTLRPGLGGTLGAAGFMFSLGTLIPPLFPITSVMAAGTLALGVITTGLMTFYHRKKVQNLMVKKFHNKAFEKAVFKKLKHKKIDDARKVSSRNKISKFTVWNMRLVTISILLRISSYAKYAMSSLGRITSLGIQVFALLSSAVQAFSNYRERQGWLDNLHAVTHDFVHSVISSKEIKKVIAKDPDGARMMLKLGESHQDIYKSYLVLKKSKKDPDKDRIKEFEKILKREKLKDNFAKFSSKILENSVARLVPHNFNHQILNDYLADVLGKGSDAHVRTAAYWHNFRICASLGTLSFIFPPITAFVWMAAATGFLIGILVTELVVNRERKKLQTQLSRLLDGSIKLISPLSQDELAQRYVENNAETFKIFLKLPAQTSLKNLLAYLDEHQSEVPVMRLREDVLNHIKAQAAGLQNYSRTLGAELAIDGSAKQLKTKIKINSPQQPAKNLADIKKSWFRQDARTLLIAKNMITPVKPEHPSNFKNPFRPSPPKT